MKAKAASTILGEATEASGIYLLLCRETGDTYVGQAQNLKRRLMNHRDDFRTHFTKSYLFRDLIYGHEFIFTVLQFCEVDRLCELEATWMIKLEPTLNCMRPRGQCHRVEDLFLVRYRRKCAAESKADAAG